MQNGESEGSRNFEAGFLEKFKKRVGRYARHYSDAKFWKKTGKFAGRIVKKAGRAVLKPALILYFASQDADTPAWARAIMIGALGYFISLVDAIPDITPVAGYTDDLWVIAIATVVVAAHIKEEHIKKAEEILNRWFGEDS